MPAEVARSPFAAEAAEYERLRDEHQEAERAVAAAAEKVERADREDRQANADAAAGGKRDPGHKHRDRVVREVEPLRRRAVGLGDAARAAYAALEARVRTDGPGWARDLAGEARRHREELTAALDAADAAMAEIDRVATAAVWVARAAEPDSAGITGQMPSGSGPTSKPVMVSARPEERGYLLEALRRYRADELEAP